MMDGFFVLVILLAFCGVVSLGALCAKLLGYKLNEPEYYEYRERNKQ